MAGKNLRKQQFQSNKLNMPSISGAIKDSGAVRFDLASIHKGPQAKETDESRLVNFAFEESETDQIGEENAEEVGRKKLDHIDETWRVPRATYDIIFWLAFRKSSSMS